jgi:hypothetical protein
MKEFFCCHFMLALAILFCVSPVSSQEGLLCDENGCAAAVAPVEYSGRDAWRLTDGKTEAIVVPALGRLMSFRRVGGENWLWDNSDAARKSSGKGWKNWGGDKTWLAPQARWNELGGKAGWPPPREWDGAPFQSQILSGGKLKIWGPVSPVTGTRISRVFYHDENGDFVVEQTVSKVEGAAIEASIWSVAQVASKYLNAVFLPLSQASAYENGFRWLNEKPGAEVSPMPRAVAPNVLQVVPAGVAFKIGTDAPRATIAAMRGTEVLMLKSARPDGIYPDGQTSDNGLPIELFNSGDAINGYVELELLSPLLQFKSGERRTHAVRWSVHSLPSADVGDAAVHAAVGALLN